MTGHQPLATKLTTAGYLSTSYQSEVALVFMLAILIVQAGRQRTGQEEG